MRKGTSKTVRGRKPAYWADVVESARLTVETRLERRLQVSAREIWDGEWEMCVMMVSKTS
jgi:hypothetical protein